MSFQKSTTDFQSPRQPISWRYGPISNKLSDNLQAPSTQPVPLEGGAGRGLPPPGRQSNEGSRQAPTSAVPVHNRPHSQRHKPLKNFSKCRGPGGSSPRPPEASPSVSPPRATPIAPRPARPWPCSRQAACPAP